MNIPSPSSEFLTSPSSEFLTPPSFTPPTPTRFKPIPPPRSSSKGLNHDIPRAVAKGGTPHRYHEGEDIEEGYTRRGLSHAIDPALLRFQLSRMEVQPYQTFINSNYRYLEPGIQQRYQRIQDIDPFPEIKVSRDAYENYLNSSPRAPHSAHY